MRHTGEGYAASFSLDLPNMTYPKTSVDTGLEPTDDPPLMHGVWMQLEDFRPEAPLYPDGLLEVLRSHLPTKGTP
jgi:hypothetical protein